MKTFTCACGDTYTETIDATGHNHETVVTAPTCTETGYTTYTCACGDSYTGNEVGAAGHNYVDGVCDVCGDKETIEPDVYLRAIGLELNAEILLYLKFEIPNEVLSDDTIKVKVTKDGMNKEVITTYSMAEIRNLEKDNSGRYIIKQALASPELGRDVKVQFIDANNKPLYIYDYASGAIDNYIIRQGVDFAKRALPAGNADQKKLSYAILVYGGYAQQRFGVDADNPIYNILPEMGLDIPSLDEITAETVGAYTVKSGDNIGIQQTTSGAELESVIAYRVNFKLDAGHTIDEYSFTLTTKNGTVPVNAEYNSSAKTYHVWIRNIASPDMDYMYKIQVTHKETGKTYVVESSIMCWVTRVLENAQTQLVEQVNMAKAMYYYNKIANEVFEKV